MEVFPEPLSIQQSWLPGEVPVENSKRVHLQEGSEGGSVEGLFDLGAREGYGADTLNATMQHVQDTGDQAQ